MDGRSFIEQLEAVCQAEAGTLREKISSLTASCLPTPHLDSANDCYAFPEELDRRIT